MGQESLVKAVRLTTKNAHLAQTMRNHSKAMNQSIAPLKILIFSTVEFSIMRTISRQTKIIMETNRKLHLPLVMNSPIGTRPLMASRAPTIMTQGRKT